MRLTNYSPDAQTNSGFKIFSVLASGASVLASLLILIGLAFDFYPFKGLIVGMATPKPLGAPLGAVGFLSASLALLLLQQTTKEKKSWRRILGLIFAGLTFLIGGTVLLEYTLGADFGIDRLLFREVVITQAGVFPGRPIFLVSVCQTILGLALIAIHSKIRGLDFSVFGIFFVGLIAMTEYIYGSAHLASVGSSRPFPLPSAILLLLISMGYLTSRPESHFMAPISSPFAGGQFARRFFPAAILLPLLLGWLEIIGQRVGWYTNEFGSVLFSTTSILIFIGLIYWNVMGLNDVDIQRYTTSIFLRRSEARFRLLFNATPSGLLMVSDEGQIALANATAENLFGYEPDQLTGKPVEILLPERYRSQHPMFRQIFENESHPRMSVTGRNLFGLRQDGSEFPVEISLNPVESVEGRFTLASVTDITERKQAENEIRSLNATLEQRVIERTQQLEYERARWQRIVEGMADEVWSCDANGRVSLLNLGSAAMLGLEPFRDKSMEEVYQEVEFLYPDGRPRPPEESPLLQSLHHDKILRGEEILCNHRTDIKRYRQYSSAPMQDETGGLTGAVAIVRDITDQKRAKEVLSRYELLSANSKDIVLFIDRETLRILEANVAAVKAYGYGYDELLKLTLLDLRAPDTHHLIKDQMAQVRSGGQLFETTHIRRDGSTFPAEVSSQTATINGAHALISIVRDITERKRAEEELRKSQQLLQAIIDNTQAPIYVKDLDGRLIVANKPLAQVFGMEIDEILGKTSQEIVGDPQDANAHMANDEQVIQSGQSITFEESTPERTFISLKFPLRDAQGRIFAIGGVSTDITERKRAEEKISNALHEKEVLLKEIHHRVKNNLQVISSLLRLQSAGIQDIAVRELFGDSQRRVRAMALIHEQLYQSSNLAKINMRDYISSLVNYLRKSYAQTIPNLEIRINVEDVVMEIDRAMPLGLLINELVSNSLKYAFPPDFEQQKGEVWINAEMNNGSLTLIVGDNGVGLPDDFDIKRKTSMGLQLVDSFISQLHGRLTIQRKGGTVFTIFIPDKSRDGYIT